MSTHIKRARTSSKRKTHQNSNKVFINKHLAMINDPGAGERGQGYTNESRMSESN
jgi:hypothetical protein